MKATSLTAVASIAAIALLIYLFTNSVINFHRLRHIPGPASAGWSKWWFLRQTLGGKVHVKLREASDTYGPLVRIGPNELATCNPDDFRKILGVKSKHMRSAWFECIKFIPDRENLVSQRDEVAHKTMRAKMAAGYSGKENAHLETTIDANVTRLVHLLVTKYTSTTEVFKPVDISRIILFFTLDTISEVAFGEAFGDLENDEDRYGYLAMLEKAMPVVMFTGVFPWLAKLGRSRLLRGLVPSDRDRLGLGRVMGIAKGLVAERFGPDKKVKQDMLGSFVKHGLTQEELESETIVQMLAGSDTTSSAIRSMLIHVLSSPRIHNRLVSELAFPPIPLSSPISDAQARQLPYLQAVIKEALRVLPPAPGIAHREIASGGEVLSGYQVPAGTWIGLNFFGLVMSESVFGADARMFRPERWLVDEEEGDQELQREKIRRMELDAELVFNYGKWQCLGKNVALMELNKVLPELLRNFEIEIVYPMEPMKSFSAGVHLVSDMWMKVSKRKLAIRD